MATHCDICSMDFQDNTAFRGHLTGKKHLKRFQQSQFAERSIYVSPLPKEVSERDILNFFHRYGGIEWHRFGSNNLIIQFDNREATEILLSQTIWIANTKLEIKRRIMHNDYNERRKLSNKDAVDNLDPIGYKRIKHIFKSGATFDSQLSEFMTTVQLTAEEIETRYASVCVQLDKIFKNVFPKCMTYKFGSTQTGLGFKGCDLDIYMDIGEPVYELENVRRDLWTMPKIFREVKKVMFRANQVFSKIVSIPRAKVPIIKFCHVPTNVSCDISFKNSLGIYKSHLIKYCISLDDRLEPLMMLIKYWARHFRISGTGKISNYALVMLIIFYLQQSSVNIIPPLTELQKNCEPQIVNGWQVNFGQNTDLPPIANTNSIPQLLHGFFFFYATFEFKSQVICPLDGTSHTEFEFKEIEPLPACMDRYKAYAKEDESISKLFADKPICVQDPIDLGHNVTGNTPSSILKTFVKYCALGSETCAIASNYEYKDLISTLLTKQISEDIFKATITGRKFPAPSKNQTESEEASDESEISNDEWYSKIFNVVKEVLEKVVKVEVQTVDTAGVAESKQQKIDAASDVHTKEYQKIMLHCRGDYAVWRNRQVKGFILDPSLSYLEKEALTSDETVEELKKDETVDTVQIDFICMFEKKKLGRKVLLTLSDQNCGVGVFHECARFARRKILDVIVRQRSLEARA